MHPAPGPQRLAHPMEKDGLLSFPVAGSQPTDGAASSDGGPGGQRLLLSKGLSRTATHRHNHPAGSQTLSGARNPPGLSATLENGTVPGRSKNHAANGVSARTHSRNGRPRNVRAVNRT